MKMALRGFEEAVDQKVKALDGMGFANRFWEKDGTLWGDDPERVAFINKFLGWTDIARRLKGEIGGLMTFRDELLLEGFTDLVVLGLGGSSLSSLVFATAYPAANGLKIHVLDSTDPGTVLGLRDALDLQKTVVVVASKSGTTVEPVSFEEFFWAEYEAAGIEDRGRHFLAVTDPGTLMGERAEDRGYRRTFVNDPEIGGRFSVLSFFGMVPAALGGLDVEMMLNKASEIGSDTAGSCAHDGFRLGAVLGVLTQAGRDKVTFLTSDRMGALGLWAEQLVAESTGKGGVGTLPLALEPVGVEEVYGKDRVFVVVGSDPEMVAPEWIEDCEIPTIWRQIEEPEELAYEFLIWEMATAVCGAVLGVNPFDQPNVQEAKDIAKRELVKVQETGKIGLGKPDLVEERFEIFGFDGDLSGFLNSAQEGNHVGFLGFVPESGGVTERFDRLRASVRDRLRVATSFGYGPRYLHSTGQYHKGGPEEQMFVMVTCEDAVDTEIPGMGVTFGQLKMAQALGDVGALQANGRRVIHVRVKGDLSEGLDAVLEKLGV